MNVYSVIDEGKEIFQGTMREVMGKFDIKKDDIYRVMHAKKEGKNKLLLHRYEVQIVGKVYEPRKKPRVKVVEYEPKTPYEIAVWALRTFRNTSVNFDPYPKLLPDMLEYYGLDCRAKEVMDYPGGVKKRKKPGVHWYVEVAHVFEPTKSV